jgi:hypothetical protein
MSALLLVLAFVPFATLLAAMMWPKGERTWGKQLLPTEGSGRPYREIALMRWTTSREPRLVRVTSALTAFLGGMAFPGGFAGIVGMVAGVAVISQGSLADPAARLTLGLAMSVPTGLVIAIHCFRLFGPMLENRAATTTRMRALARFSLIHNAVVATMWLGYLVGGGDPWVAIFAVYVLISFVHVGLLRRAADVMDRRSEESLACERALEDAGANVLVEELPARRAHGSSAIAEPEILQALGAQSGSTNGRR